MVVVVAIVFFGTKTNQRNVKTFFKSVGADV